MFAQCGHLTQQVPVNNSKTILYIMSLNDFFKKLKQQKESTANTPRLSQQDFRGFTAWVMNLVCCQILCILMNHCELVPFSRVNNRQFRVLISCKPLTRVLLSEFVGCYQKKEENGGTSLAKVFLPILVSPTLMKYSIEIKEGFNDQTKCFLLIAFSDLSQKLGSCLSQVFHGIIARQETGYIIRGLYYNSAHVRL